jgi:hypothetical protein
MTILSSTQQPPSTDTTTDPSTTSRTTDATDHYSRRTNQRERRTKDKSYKIK